MIKQINDQFAVKLLDGEYIDKCIDLRVNNRADIAGEAFSFTFIPALRHLLDKQYLSTKPSWAYRGYGVVDVETNALACNRV